MGIRDFFRRNKKEKPIVNNTNVPDCRLSYRSGINADINFTELQQLQIDNATTKIVQSVTVMYNMPDGTFQQKNIIWSQYLIMMVITLQKKVIYN